MDAHEGKWVLYGPTPFHDETPIEKTHRLKFTQQMVVDIPKELRMFYVPIIQAAPTTAVDDKPTGPRTPTEKKVVAMPPRGSSLFPNGINQVTNIGLLPADRALWSRESREAIQSSVAEMKKDTGGGGVDSGGGTTARKPKDDTPDYVETIEQQYAFVLRKMAELKIPCPFVPVLPIPLKLTMSNELPPLDDRAAIFSMVSCFGTSGATEDHVITIRDNHVIFSAINCDDGFPLLHHEMSLFNAKSLKSKLTLRSLCVFNHTPTSFSMLILDYEAGRILRADITRKAELVNKEWWTDTVNTKVVIKPVKIENNDCALPIQIIEASTSNLARGAVNRNDTGHTWAVPPSVVGDLPRKSATTFYILGQSRKSAMGDFTDVKFDPVLGRQPPRLKSGIFCLQLVSSHCGVMQPIKLHDEIVHPTSIATCYGQLFVSDYHQHCIWVFTPDKNLFTGMWSHVGHPSDPGDSDGQAYQGAKFKNPYGLSVDKAGWIYVADEQNNRIRMFHPLCNYIVSTVKLFDNQISKVNKPVQVLCLPISGQVLVINDTNNVMMVRPWLKHFELATLTFLCMTTRCPELLSVAMMYSFIEITKYALDEHDPRIDEYYVIKSNPVLLRRFREALSLLRFHQQRREIEKRAAKFATSRRILLTVPGLSADRLHQIINNVAINRRECDEPLPAFCHMTDEEFCRAVKYK